MSISDVFKKVGAPLRNTRWCWGAVSEDKAVFLRVWANDFRRVGEGQTVQVTFRKLFADDPENLGHKERLEQVALIAAGAPSYCIVCTARDVDVLPRAMATYDSKTLFVGGDLLEIDGEAWLQLEDRIKINDLKKLEPSTAP